MYIKDLIMVALNLTMLGLAAFGVYSASGSWWLGMAFPLGYIILSILVEYSDNGPGGYT